MPFVLLLFKTYRVNKIRYVSHTFLIQLLISIFQKLGGSVQFHCITLEITETSANISTSFPSFFFLLPSLAMCFVLQMSWGVYAYVTPAFWIKQIIKVAMCVLDLATVFTWSWAARLLRRGESCAGCAHPAWRSCPHSVLLVSKRPRRSVLEMAFTRETQWHLRRNVVLFLHIQCSGQNSCKYLTGLSPGKVLEEPTTHDKIK